MNADRDLAIGGIFVGTGLGLFLGLPPQWWPDISAYVVHAGVISGAFLSVTGFCFFVVGICEYFSGYSFCRRILFGWRNMWTVKRAAGVFAVGTMVAFLGPFIWPSSTHANAQASSISVQQNNGETANTINQFGPTYNAAGLSVSKGQVPSTSSSNSAPLTAGNLGGPPSPMITVNGGTMNNNHAVICAPAGAHNLATFNDTQMSGNGTILDVTPNAPSTPPTAS
jgi:hypothetical protein